MEKIDRRDLLAGAGATALTAALAGCSSLLNSGQSQNSSGSSNNSSSQQSQSIPNEPIQAGGQTTLEGPASVFGVPSRQGADLAISRINNSGGIAGRNIEIEWINEANPVQNYNRFVQQEKEVVFGPTSSAAYRELAPVVEDQGVVNLAFAGNFTNLFYDVVEDPTFSFRPSNMVLMQDMAAALTAQSRLDSIDRVAGINPDYSAGRGSMRNFTNILDSMTGGVNVVYDGYPQLGASDFSSHITSALNSNPDVIFTILWGSDIVTFLNQAISAGMFNNDIPVISHYTYNQLNDIGSSVVQSTNGNLLAGSRNFYWNHPSHNRYQSIRQFVQTVRNRHNAYPSFSFMEGYMSVTAWATAVEKAVNTLGGWPTQEQISSALEGHGYYTPGGYHVIRNDHQGYQPEFYGVVSTSNSAAVPILENVRYFGAEEVGPPPNQNPTEWRNSWNF